MSAERSNIAYSSDATEDEKPLSTNGGEQTINDVMPSFDGKRWYQLAHMRSLIWSIFVISLASCNTGYDGSLLNSLYTEDDFNNIIGNVSGAVLGALSNGLTFGCILSVLVAPYICDNYGRVMGIYVGNAFAIIGVIIQSCAGTWFHNGVPENYEERDVFGMLLAARIILGFGVGIATVACPTLTTELAFPTQREACTAYYNTSWYLGAIVSSWVAYGCRNVAHHWNWRIPSIVQGFFPVVQLVLTPFCVPESPRYYVSIGKVDQARKVLDKYHGGGYEGADKLIDYELTEIELAIQQERAASEQSKYSDFFKTSANRKRLWIIFWMATFMQLSGNGLVSYYLSKVLNSIGITSTDEQLVVNGGLMIYNWGVTVIEAVWLVPRMKRRHVFTVSISGMLICYIIWTILSAINQERNFEQKSLANGVLAMIFFYYLFYNWGCNGIPFAYLTEILPFTMRAKGLNIFQAIEYVWIIYNGFVNSVAMEAIEWKYYIVWCCILVVELIVEYTTFVETSGYTLEEVAQVFGDAGDLQNRQTLNVNEEA